jgi:hypothetical protein
MDILYYETNKKIIYYNKKQNKPSSKSSCVNNCFSP